jgi:nucleoid-associated protein YgaU
MAASGILVIGLVLAWPFRKTVRDIDPVSAPPVLPSETLRATNGDPIAGAHPATIVPVAPDLVAVHMASTEQPEESPRRATDLNGFDIANHPALTESSAAENGAQDTVPTEHTTQPAYDTVDTATQTDRNQWPAELIHVVANGDTLEKLAERYLGDPGRALEIFDLNRDQLGNPHLLPIGVELRVPRNPERIID